MGKNTKYLWWGGALLTAIAGGVYLFKVKRLSDQLEAVTGVLVHKFSFPDLTLSIKVKLKNPTGGSIKVKHPFVKMLSGESVVGTSTVLDKDYTIPKFGEVTLETIYLPINLFSTGLLGEYLKTKKLNLSVKTITTINNALPYEKIDKMTV